MQPVVSVSWFDAHRLLRLAEPRRPAAATVCRRKPNGSAPRAAASKARSTPGVTTRRCAPGLPSPWSGKSTARVRSAKSRPTAYGIFDLGENVHEWCADWFDKDYYASLPRAQSIAGPAAGDPPRLARRLLAPPHQGNPLRCPVQHSAAVPVCRLRLPRESAPPRTRVREDLYCRPVGQVGNLRRVVNPPLITRRLRSTQRQRCFISNSRIWLSLNIPSVRCA